MNINITYNKTAVSFYYFSRITRLGSPLNAHSMFVPHNLDICIFCNWSLTTNKSFQQSHYVTCIMLHI